MPFGSKVQAPNTVPYQKASRKSRPLGQCQSKEGMEGISDESIVISQKYPALTLYCFNSVTYPNKLTLALIVLCAPQSPFIFFLGTQEH